MSDPERPGWLWDTTDPNTYDLSEMGEVRTYIEHLEARIAELEATLDAVDNTREREALAALARNYDDDTAWRR